METNKKLYTAEEAAKMPYFSNSIPDRIDEQIVDQHPRYISEGFTILNPKYEYTLRITDNFNITSLSRPNWFHRLMHRLLLGWRWK